MTKDVKEASDFFDNEIYKIRGVYPENCNVDFKDEETGTVGDQGDTKEAAGGDEGTVSLKDSSIYSDTKSIEVNIPKLNELEFFDKSMAYTNLELRAKLESDSNLEKAYFLHEHALEYSWVFLVMLTKQFKEKTYIQKVSGCIKNNLMRIQDAIANSDCYSVKDMIRATIRVRNPRDF